jgi:hypothetical protein
MNYLKSFIMIALMSVGVSAIADAFELQEGQRTFLSILTGLIVWFFYLMPMEAIRAHEEKEKSEDE